MYNPPLASNSPLNNPKLLWFLAAHASLWLELGYRHFDLQRWPENSSLSLYLCPQTPKRYPTLFPCGIFFTKFNFINFKNLSWTTYLQGSHKLWKSWKIWKNHEKKFHAWKNHGIWKNLNNHGKIMEFCEIIWRNSQKLAVRHTSNLCVWQLVFWLLVVFQNACMVYKHAYLNTLLLLHSASMLCAVKMPLKGEVWGCALKVMKITLLIMENHGKIMELCFWISVGTLYLTILLFLDFRIDF